MTEPTTPQQSAADVYWQEVAPDDYELLLQATTPEEDDDDAVFLWLALGFYYVNRRTGRRIPAKAIRSILDKAIINGRGLTDTLGRQLIDGAIKPAKWYQEMSRLIEDSQRAGAAAAKGGWGQLTGADDIWLKGRVDNQMSFLDGFLDDLKTGKQKLDGNFLRRSRMYIDSSRGTYEEQRGRLHQAGGATHAARILGPADHCFNCVDWSIDNHGWWLISSVPPIGSSVCKTNCHCTIVYGRELSDGTIENYGG